MLRGEHLSKDLRTEEIDLRRRLAIWLTVGLLLIGLFPGQAAQSAPAIPLLLVHGLFGSPNTTWGAAVQWFEARGYVQGSTQGSTLFTVDLRPNLAESKDLGVLADANYVAQEIRSILADTGATQVDLVGNSRGGLIVRLLATGEMSPLIHRAVTIDTPHSGVLSRENLLALLTYANISADVTSGFNLPLDLQSLSGALRTMKAREERFADRRAPALAIATRFPDGHPPLLQGHDGFVSVSSQTAWPGARTLELPIGPTPEQLAGIVAEGSITKMIYAIPHVSSPENEAVLSAVLEFINGDAAAPARACEPACQDWEALAGTWSAGTVAPMLPDLLPYELDGAGNRLFDPNRKITRAEFVYALDRATGVNEKLGITAFADTPGHWAEGYVEAAVAHKLVTGLSPDSFGPDRPLNRAQAATLITRVKNYTPSAGPSRFADARGHWAESYIEAAAEQGIIKGDEGGFRPEDPLTMAEAAVIISRAFPR